MGLAKTGNAVVCFNTFQCLLTLLIQFKHCILFHKFIERLTSLRQIRNECAHIQDGLVIFEFQHVFLSLELIDCFDFCRTNFNPKDGLCYEFAEVTTNAHSFSGFIFSLCGLACRI